MPHVDAGHILSYLFELGPKNADDPVKIRNWMELIGIELQPWEVRFIRRLSGEYLSTSHKAEKADCPEPLREQAEYVPDLSAVAKSMQNALQELSKL